jgi:hypothetical protein
MRAAFIFVISFWQGGRTCEPCTHQRTRLRDVNNSAWQDFLSRARRSIRYPRTAVPFFPYFSTSLKEFSHDQAH